MRSKVYFTNMRATPELNLLQKYVFLPLDIFRENMHNKGITDKLDAWLAFLSMDSPEVIVKLIKKYPELDLCFLTHMADSFLVIRNEYYLDNELKKYLRKYLKKYFLKFMLNRIGIGIKIELFKTMLKINGTTDVKKQKLTDDMFD